MVSRRWIWCLVFFASIVTPVGAEEGLKIYISADMEGVVGAVTGEQLGPGGFEYEKFRELVTAEVNAAIAGHFGVPVLMISGDDAIVAATRDLLGDVEDAVVKEAISLHSAATLLPAAALMPAAALRLIAEKVTAGVERLDDFEPFALAGPIELEVGFKDYRPPQLLSYLPMVEQVDSHTIRHVAEDMVEVLKFMEVLTSCEVSLAP